MDQDDLKINKKPRVLIVDDEQMIRQVLHAVLTEAGLIVQGEARSGREALSALSYKQADIVLLDINMPGEDGLTVLKQIHEKYPETKVIMISGDATMNHVKQAMQEGAIDFISKPFSPQSVMEKMKKFAE